jgi:starvation-inducible DNA-binding protein
MVAQRRSTLEQPTRSLSYRVDIARWPTFAGAQTRNPLRQSETIALEDLTGTIDRTCLRGKGANLGQRRFGFARSRSTDEVRERAGHSSGLAPVPPHPECKAIEKEGGSKRQPGVCESHDLPVPVSAAVKRPSMTRGMHTTSRFEGQRLGYSRHDAPGFRPDMRSIKMATKKATSPSARTVKAPRVAKATEPKSPGNFTVPGMARTDGIRVAGILQERLGALIDLGLTLKHVHWNVVGATFIGVHTMLDPQVDGVAAMVDATAERIATLGSSPNGLPGNLVSSRSWDDYPLQRGLVPEHLGALDRVYVGVIDDHRKAVESVSDLDPITEDLLIGQSGILEQYHWFVRAHLESASGQLHSNGVGR